LFTARDIVRALGPRVPIALAVFALGIGLFDLFFVRRTSLEFFHHGRPVIGEVVVAVPALPSDDVLGRRRISYSTVRGLDVELGWQTVEISEVRRVGERVPMLCLTSARRCEPAQDVSSYLARWPASAAMMSAAVTLALALFLAIVLILDARAMRRRSVVSRTRG
jgi:hypothetical protein